MKIDRSIFIFLLGFVGVFTIFYFAYDSYQSREVAKDEQSFLNSLTSFEDFQKFAGSPLDDAYPTITSVKVVYDLHRKEIYFINSHLYRLHYDFCTKVLGYSLGLNFFNIANYGKKRDYYLGNINYLKKNDLFVLEFSSSDEIDSLQIIDMYKQISKTTFIKNKLQLLLNNTNSIHYFADQRTLPTCDVSTLTGGLNYQMIQKGSCTGRLILVEDLKSNFLEIKANDILIVNGSPTELPLCKAVVSDCFQTPLSHIQVLSHNKKMPSAYLEKIFSNDTVKKYNGKNVKLVVSEDTLIISASTEENIVKGKSELISLNLNTGIRSIIPIEKCGPLTNADIGTKAKGLSDLKEISEKNADLFLIPEGAFVIPFYFYQEHLKLSKCDVLLTKLRKTDIDNTKRIAEILSEICKAIETTPLSKELLSSVNKQIEKNKAGESYRFRSSSNAEDLLNFSGAGLYESKTGQLNSAKKSVEKAIKKVWASMYNYRAYQERYFANIDERTAGMSILVHRNFPDEDINGVIITKNIYREEYPAIVVNAQKGDVSTVSPPDSVVCEQFILTQNKLMNPFSKRVSAKYLSYSSLHPGSPLLNYDQLVLLQKSTDVITTYYESKNLAWDLEFKFEKNKLYIKQVRPYR